MKNILFLLLITVGCSISLKKDKEGPTQEYIMVDDKVTAYHDDGRRTYKDYQPFPTRTVELLKDYQIPEKIPALSKYGGIINFKEKTHGVGAGKYNPGI